MNYCNHLNPFPPGIHFPETLVGIWFVAATAGTPVPEMNLVYRVI